MKRKPCMTGKTQYKSKQQADDAKHHIQNCKGEAADFKVYSYHCHICRCWHHGGVFRRQMEEIRERGA